jgi:hypothetical protein
MESQCNSCPFVKWEVLPTGRSWPAVRIGSKDTKRSFPEPLFC